MERAMPPVYLFALLGMLGFLHVANSGTPDGRRGLPPWIRWAGVLLLVAFLSTSVVFVRKAVLSDIYYTKGVRLTHAGQYTPAVAVLDEARRLSPRNVDALLMLANNHAGKGHFELAIEMLHEVLRFHPHKVNAISNLGYCYLQVRDYDQAETYFRKSLEILPESPQIFTNLGTAYFEQGMHDFAIDAYRKAVELAQTKPFLPSVRTEARLLQPRLLLANAYVTQHRLDEAIEQYEEILRHAPGRQDLRRLLAELYRTIGEPDKAREVLGNLTHDEPR
jgi:tetratricopeptide (TPR) repeat protein